MRNRMSTRMSIDDKRGEWEGSDHNRMVATFEIDPVTGQLTRENKKRWVWENRKVDWDSLKERLDTVFGEWWENGGQTVFLLADVQERYHLL